MSIGFVSYADHSAASGDSDITAPLDPDEEARRRGYVGGGDLGINNNLTQGASEDWSPDGGEAIVNGYRQQGTSAYDHDVDRYRQMGAAGMNRQAAQLDQTQSNQDRGIQLGALGLMRTAAEGGAPSRAVAMNHAATDATIRGAVGSTGGARGPGASIAAMNGAQAGAANRMAAQNAQFTDMRGNEMATAQNQFASGAQGMEGQDISAAEANAKLQANQRALNEQRQENFERMGYDTRKTQSQAADRFARDLANENNTRTQNQQQRDALDWSHVSDDASTAASLIAHSDDRTKMGIHPIAMGSLSGLSRFMHGRR